MSSSQPVCRSCGATDLATVLSLGNTPLANGLRTAAQLNEPEDTYPLDLVFCCTCTLLQITETVPPEQLFSDYFYRSSYSDTMLRHAEQLAQRTILDEGLDSTSLVIEVASNDGYLLRYYQQRGVPVLGIEPAANIAQFAVQECGVPTLCEFFGEHLAKQLQQAGRQADVVHAHNVLAHVPDLNGFVSGLSRILKGNGRVIIEVPYVRDMIDGNEFDTIYHEHLCYFSCRALDALLRRHDFIIEDVERLAIHGGSLRISAAKGGNRRKSAASASVSSLLQTETALGMDQLGFYCRFADQVQRLREDLLRLLRDLKARGNRIAVYGASAKGSTLLNYCGIGGNLVEFVVDRSPVKQNHYTPGTDLPIYAPEKLLEELPEYTLLLTWNFAEEILSQQSEYRQRGGRFVIPIPEVRIV